MKAPLKEGNSLQADKNKFIYLYLVGPGLGGKKKQKQKKNKHAIIKVVYNIPSIGSKFKTLKKKSK